MVHVVRPVAQVVRGDFDQALLLRLPSRLRLSTSKYSGNTDTISIFIMFHNTGTPAKRGAYEKGAGIIASALLEKQRIRAPE